MRAVWAVRVSLRFFRVLPRFMVSRVMLTTYFNILLNGSGLSAVGEVDFKATPKGFVSLMQSH